MCLCIVLAGCILVVQILKPITIEKKKIVSDYTLFLKTTSMKSRYRATKDPELFSFSLRVATTRTAYFCCWVCCISKPVLGVSEQDDIPRHEVAVVDEAPHARSAQALDNFSHDLSQMRAHGITCRSFAPPKKPSRLRSPVFAPKLTQSSSSHPQPCRYALGRQCPFG